MAIYKLKVNVHCSRPNWVFEPRNIEYSKSSYRLYLNNELMIERGWVWEDSSYIQEELSIDIQPGAICTLKLEPVVKNIAQVKFSLKDLTSNDRPIPQQNDLEISFVI